MGKGAAIAAGVLVLVLKVILIEAVLEFLDQPSLCSIVSDAISIARSN